ncbi:MAG TPA: DUF459 domain-containing protein [Devosia sp.]
MDRKRNPFILWIAGLVILALLLGDLAASLAEEVTILPDLRFEQAAATDGGILVAQEQQQRPRRRKTLMDLLFGGDEQQQQQVPEVIEQPVVRQPKVADVPPAKPAIPKADNAVRLAVFGDSLANDLAKALDRFYAEDPNIAIIAQGVGDTGFVRTDVMDWRAKINEAITANTFDIAVFIIGINDRQKMRINDASYGSLSPEWSAEYQNRVAAVVSALRAANKPTIWVGLPPMSKTEYNKTMSGISEIQRLAAFGGGAEFLDIYERFVDDEGKYTSYGPDLNGKNVRMRKDDGIHFTSAGADKLAFYLAQTLKLYYRGAGSVGLEVADPLLGTDAQLMLRPPYQGLGQMQLLEVAGAVISLTNAQRRATDLVIYDPEALTPVQFDTSLMLEAPAGRADAFGVGKPPDEEAEPAPAAPVAKPTAALMPVAGTE